jgi:hypothetical protein
MITVAAVALMLGGLAEAIRLQGLRRRYQSLALINALEESMWRSEGDDPDARAMADYNARLKAKYQRAAAHPWLSVAPDPLPPPPPSRALFERWSARWQHDHRRTP